MPRPVRLERGCGGAGPAGQSGLPPCPGTVLSRSSPWSLLNGSEVGSPGVRLGSLGRVHTGSGHCTDEGQNVPR